MNNPRTREDDTVLASLLNGTPASAAANVGHMLSRTPYPSASSASTAPPQSSTVIRRGALRRDDEVVARLLGQRPMVSLNVSGAWPLSPIQDEQSRDDAALMAVISATPTQAANGIKSVQPIGVAHVAQSQRDDAVLSKILRGQLQSASRQSREDVALASVLGLDMCKVEDDSALARLLHEGKRRPSLNRRPSTSPTRSRDRSVSAPRETNMKAQVEAVAKPIQGLQAGIAERRPQVEIVAGGRGRGSDSTRLYRPLGVAVDSFSGAIIVADNGNGRLVRWVYGSNFGQIVPDVDQLLVDPIGVVLDRTGSLLSSAGGMILDVPNAGDTPRVLATGFSPSGIALEAGGALVFADSFEHRVVRCILDSSGSIFDMQVIAGGGHGLPRHGSRLDQLHRPSDVAIDGHGAVLVVDTGNHRVVRWARQSKECKGEVVAGGRGKGSGLHQLNYPRGIAYDEYTGAILVSDTLNHRVMRWFAGDSKGEVIAGGRGQGCRVDQLNKPVGLALDAGNARLLVADSGNHRVSRWVVLPVSPRRLRELRF